MSACDIPSERQRVRSLHRTAALGGYRPRLLPRLARRQHRASNVSRRPSCGSEFRPRYTLSRRDSLREISTSRRVLILAVSSSSPTSSIQCRGDRTRERLHHIGAAFTRERLGLIARELGSRRLEVVGEGPERPRLQSLAPSHVGFLGNIPPLEVPLILQRARALLYPSRWYEAQPRAILEAFAAGVPIIASRIGGLTELVNHGVKRCSVDVDDVRGWRDAVDRLQDDRESARLGEGAYQTWLEKFTPEIALEALLSVYQEVGLMTHNRPQSQA